MTARGFCLLGWPQNNSKETKSKPKEAQSTSKETDDRKTSTKKGGKKIWKKGSGTKDKVACGQSTQSENESEMVFLQPLLTPPTAVIPKSKSDFSTTATSIKSLSSSRRTPSSDSSSPPSSSSSSQQQEAGASKPGALIYKQNRIQRQR